MHPSKPYFSSCSPAIKPRNGFVVVLDVGTTGVKAFIFNGSFQIVEKAYLPLQKKRPKRGWVEQDPHEILRSSRLVLKKAIAKSGIDPRTIKGMGITNQREATILWDKKTGRTVYPVIGWEDTRTRARSAVLRKKHFSEVAQKTGLLIDSYFSATKIRWILENVPKAKTLLAQDRLLFGTIDTWLIWNFCDERPHVTDETNASRTLLFDIRRKQWATELLDLFGVPKDLLPQVLPSRSVFAHLSTSLLGGRIPILAVCGDQQASTYAAMRVGSKRPKIVTKVTYGTGVFIVQLLGKSFAWHPPFFTTLVPALGKGSAYALEAKIEGSGETVDRLLSDWPRLLFYFRRLAKQVKLMIDQLPISPEKIVVDGGIARDGYVVEIQQEALGIPACLQTPFDGTALGCALLIWDAVD